jgi:hypothetical protein
MSDPNGPADATPRWGQMLREFMRDLFDLQLRSSMAARMLPVVYLFGIALAALFVVYVVIGRFHESREQGLLWALLLGPAAFFGLVTALRITLEFVMAVFRVAWYVEQVANHTQVVSEELPRFTFMRTLLFGTRSNEPPKPKK